MQAMKDEKCGHKAYQCPQHWSIEPLLKVPESLVKRFSKGVGTACEHFPEKVKKLRDVVHHTSLKYLPSICRLFTILSVFELSRDPYKTMKWNRLRKSCTPVGMCWTICLHWHVEYQTTDFGPTVSNYDLALKIKCLPVPEQWCGVPCGHL